MRNDPFMTVPAATKIIFLVKTQNWIYVHIMDDLRNKLGFKQKNTYATKE